MDARAQQVLKVLIEQYIKDGQPIASKSVAQDKGLDCSPATVRHVMADLESAGFLYSPHTSAGRVPTAAAYRYFVDKIIKITPFDAVSLHDFEHILELKADKQALIQQATSLLSNLTSFAGLVSIPKSNHILLRQIEFLPLSGNRVLAIFVTNECDVQNRVLYTDRHYTQAELSRASSYLNAHFSGKDMLEIRRELLLHMARDKDAMNTKMNQFLQVANQAFQEEDTLDFVVKGQENLLDTMSFSSIDHIRELLNAFSHKQAIVHLLDKSMQAEGVQIFIGEESGYQAFEECGIVAAPYEMDGQSVGVLGVVGPTRMPYDKVISIVDTTAKILSEALKRD